MGNADDIVQIQMLMAEYCHRIDDGDFEVFAEMFRDGVWGMRGMRIAGGPDLLQWMRDHVVLYDGVPRTRHMNTASSITVDGDTATAVSDITIFQQVPPDFPLQAIVCVRYDDRFVRVDGSWRFRERIATARLMGDTTRHLR